MPPGICCGFAYDPELVWPSKRGSLAAKAEADSIGKVCAQNIEHCSLLD
jgi:hypothetical protein